MRPSIVGLDGKPYNTEFDFTKQINFGKTKIIAPWEDGLAVNHKDIITAFDNSDFTGEAPGKGTASAYSSALLFKRLEEKGIKTSHLGILNSNTTFEKDLDMLPFEFIWRRYNVEGNSWEVRNPEIHEIGEKYPEIKYEACLKWSVIDEAGEKVDDPFFDLDDNFQPKMQENGLPVLMHPKEPNKKLNYSKIIHPNKGNEISQEELEEALNKFNKYSSKIREMMEIVQETTFETYAEIGRLNADGKIEVGINKQNGELTLGDELELDSLRNMSLKEIIVDTTPSTLNSNSITTITKGLDIIFSQITNIINQDRRIDICEFNYDILGQNIKNIILLEVKDISKILKSNHSGKQVYRNLVKPWGNVPFGTERKIANNMASQVVTNTIYLPVAKALSDRFGKEVGYILELNN